MSKRDPINCDVHLWKYELNTIPWNSKKVREILSLEEQNRAQHFISRQDGERFASVHLFIREVLARYLHLLPSKIQFTEGLNSKPMLKLRSHEPVIHFNLSYRNEYALLAIASNAVIGVDIEEVIPMTDMSAFVSHYFSKQEQQNIFEKETRKEQLSMLFTLWTMKEALLKSLAVGMSSMLTRYNLYPFLQHASCKPSFDKRHTWNIHPIAVAENYRAAFAVPVEQIDLKQFEYGKD